MRSLYIVILTSMLALFSHQSIAKAELEITWQAPENYTDVLASNSIQKRFQTKTFTKLNSTIAQLTEKLPEGQRLLIEVKDVDLAGRVSVALTNSNYGPRVFNSLDMPRMVFTYQLVDPDGVVLQESAVNLEAPMFLSSFNPRRNSGSLPYEKRMLRNWFKEEFAERLKS